MGRGAGVGVSPESSPVRVHSRHLPQVNTSFDDWKTTKWKNINVEQMDIDCKKFAKDVRSLDKEMKTWDAFVGLDNTVKNMITSLRAVSELQNPAIRDRHWQQLMQATQVPAGEGGQAAEWGPPTAGGSCHYTAFRGGKAGLGEGTARSLGAWDGHGPASLGGTEESSLEHR